MRAVPATNATLASTKHHQDETTPQTDRLENNQIAKFLVGPIRTRVDQAQSPVARPTAGAEHGALAG